MLPPIPAPKEADDEKSLKTLMLAILVVKLVATSVTLLVPALSALPC